MTPDMPSGTKHCSRCDRTLPLASFSRNRKRSDGRQTYCKACKSLVDRSWYERRGHTQYARNDGHLARNAQHLWDYLVAHPCVDCGETDPVVLGFDHVRGVKVDALSNMSRRQFSIAKIGAEIAECEVRCANGHKRKTARERGWHVRVVDGRVAD